jgi:hypothetical protein
MILDNEEQRTIILQALTSMKISGTMQEVAQVFNVLSEITKAVQSATIQENNEISNIKTSR